MASNARGSAGAFGSHVGSNVMALVRNESSTDALAAMLASCPPVGLPGQRGGMELDAVVSCGQKRGYYPAFEGSQGEDLGADEDMGDDCMTGAHNVEKKRRLSFDQVRSLERNFEVENKLEPERKMQLAKELGLQPRQVAVWFQNRRARWKTKQLERDYEVLTSDYNRLKADYDQVLQEKQGLQGEIECLTEKLRADSPESGSADEKAESPKTRSKPAAPSSEAPVKKSDDFLGSRDTCSDSISSEILDADSPRTMDSTPQLETKNNMSVYAPIPVEVPDSIIHMSDHLCVDVQMLDQPRISVKLEDGSFQDESPCNYILTQLEEDKALPWWDWP